MVFLVWNCRGMDSKGCQRLLKEFCRQYRPNIIILVEIKVSGIKAYGIIGSLGFSNWIHVESVGYSGEIWVL